MDGAVLRGIDALFFLTDGKTNTGAQQAAFLLNLPVVVAVVVFCCGDVDVVTGREVGAMIGDDVAAADVEVNAVLFDDVILLIQLTGNNADFVAGDVAGDNFVVLVLVMGFSAFAGQETPGL